MSPCSARRTRWRSLEAAQELLGDDRVHVTGEGATVSTDVEAVGRGVSALIQAALRHGGLDEVNVVVRGPVIEVTPITDAAAPVVLGRELRDLGAAVAVRADRAARRGRRGRGRLASRSRSR